MQIDWITVSAQIINFLVLVYLLQHFLYQPVVQAMDTREQRITDRLEHAQQREADARETIGANEQKKTELENERQSMIEQYKQEAQEEKQRLMDEAREDVRHTKSQWQRQAEREKHEFLDGLRGQVEHAVADVARKVLADLADAGLEERVIEAFVARLKDMDEETRRTFAEPDGPLCISTAFELDADRRDRLTSAVQEHIREDLTVEFEVAPELVCGVRIADDGHAVDWNLADYVNQVAERMESAIESAARQS